MNDFTSNPFAGIEKAMPNEGGNYVRAGEHLFRFNGCKIINSQQKRATYFIAEFETVESTHHKVGEQVSWGQDFNNQPTLGNIRLLVSALLGCNVEDVDSDVCKGITDPSNPAGGTLVRCTATMIKSKKGHDVTKCLWRTAA